MAKLNKILESIENLKLTTEVALLENTEVTDLVRAQSKLMINENINFIKNELTKGGILEDVQFMLKNAWTQTLMEDIGLDMDFGGAKGTLLQDLGAKIAPNFDRSYAGGGMNGGRSLIGQHYDKMVRSSDIYNQDINTVQAANDALMNEAQNRHAAELAGLHAKHAAEVANLQNDINSYKNSQAGLVNTLNGTGAKLGIQADGAYADGLNKANAVAAQAQNMYGQAKDAAQALPGQAQEAYNNAKVAAGQVVDNTVNRVKALPGQAQEVYNNAKVAADQAGANVGQSIDNAKAAVGQAVDNSIAAAKGAYQNAAAGMGAKINADGTPLTNAQMAGFGGGSLGLAAAAGYGAHKLAQKVRRSGNFR